MEIKLQQVRVFGFHGLHACEEIVGGEFEITLAASYLPAQTPIKEIGETLDYTVLLAIVKERMQKPAHLLETLATEIAGEIIAKFSIVTTVVISINKLHPPIQSFEGTVGVTYTIKRN